MKKKLTAVALIVCMIAIMLVGATMAYFTDETEVKENTFTAGKVGIDLTEEAWDAQLEKLGVEVEGKDEKALKLFPGQTYAKDPTITVDSDSEDAYVAAKIVITGDLYDLIGIEGYETLNVHALASGGLLADQEGAAYGNYNGLFVFQNDNYAIHQAVNGNNTWTLYVFMKEAQVAGAEILLFEKLSIPADWDNEEMAQINGMEIDVQAFAVQSEGFDSCYAAMTAAFETEFDF